MNDIPWADAAVLLLCSERDGGERDIIAEGSLRNLVDRVAASKVGDISRLVISLPDRRAPPFHYGGAAIHELVRARRAEHAALMPIPVKPPRRRKGAAPPPSPAG